MQLYMPRHHRNFFSHLREQSRRRSLRAWVLESMAEVSTQDMGEKEEATLQLLNAYNPTITTLKKFCDAHIVLMARYIIRPAAWDKLRGNSQSLSKGMGMGTSSDSQREDLEETKGKGEMKKMKGKRETKDGNGKKEVLKGTGGTHPARFLKSVRDNTRDAVIQ
ncbi:Indoleamine 2,3-dioxygenase [Lentinula edodes]|uniref:Indoleamine 2,3-dioxygenase n=1 Tax=Lentinula lateritia TaxID=40482 RepID=A0A9W9AMS2_9AGAR|nr:Indoleamine 2,3-dioxygenase [Lentinula edodes]